MSDDQPWFRVHAVVECAFEADPSGGERLPELPVHSQRASNQARVAVSRIDRTDTELRDVARALLDAITMLERDVERLTNRLQLGDQGVNLHGELVHLGGDGMSLERRLPFAPGEHVCVYLDLPLNQQNHLVVISALVLDSLEGTSLHFERLRPDTRDRIIAFLFQMQAKERRRARDATAG